MRQVQPKPPAPEPDTNPYYPRWVTLEDGTKRLAPTPLHHSQIVGYEVDYKGDRLEPEAAAAVAIDTPAADPKSSEPEAPINFPLVAPSRAAKSSK